MIGSESLTTVAAAKEDDVSMDTADDVDLLDPTEELEQLPENGDLADTIVMDDGVTH